VGDVDQILATESEKVVGISEKLRFSECPALEVPDRKVDVYLMSNFEPKYVINLCPRLKLFWDH
jgi:hypothetical protein